MTRVWIWLLVTAAVKLRMHLVTCWSSDAPAAKAFACASSSAALIGLGEQIIEADIRRIVQSMQTTVPESEVLH